VDVADFPHGRVDRPGKESHPEEVAARPDCLEQPIPTLRRAPQPVRVSFRLAINRSFAPKARFKTKPD
jgi:hypothetical protein